MRLESEFALETKDKVRKDESGLFL